MTSQPRTKLRIVRPVSPQAQPQPPPPPPQGGGGDFSDTPFASIGGLSRETLAALTERMGFRVATRVQALAIPVVQRGGDALVKARTGSGKTLAFLVPALERIFAAQQSSKRASVAAAENDAGCVLVLEPTRELACQTADEARSLLATRPGARVLAVYGGTNPRREADELRRLPAPTVLVATPGRLLDHLQQRHADCLARTNVLVFDEADDLLDMGFRPTIERILALLPPKDQRQTLLFSATFPDDIRRLAELSLRSGFASVDAVVSDADSSAASATPTVEMVEQEYECTSVADQAAVMLARVTAERAAGGRSICFFATARITAFFAALWRALPYGMGKDVIELHSRMSQSQRTRSRDAFISGGPGALLFTSDLSARGVDYPDVSLVLQVGMAADRTQYVHRVGRTARAGKDGRGLLLLADFEVQHSLKLLRGIPIQAATPSNPRAVQLAHELLGTALPLVDETAKGGAYRTWLGFYKATAPKYGWQPAELVARANDFARVIGCARIPGITKRAIGKMGLRGVPGLVIEAEPQKPPRQPQKKVSKGTD